MATNKQGMLTDRSLQKKPQKNDVWLADPAPRGHGRFYARITPQGQKLFYFKYSHDGRREYVRLGAYNPSPQNSAELTLAQARNKAGELSRLYQSGVTDIREHLAEKQRLEAERISNEIAHLADERRAAKSRLTVAQHFDQWAGDELSKRKDGGKEAKRMLNKDVVPVIGNRYLEEITKADIRQITKSIQKRGANVLAREVFTLMRQMFQAAVDDELIENNPTASLNKKKLVSAAQERTRVLSEDEIQLLTQQLKNSGLLPTAKAAIWICLSTCCRIGELSQARWEHIDFDKQTWVIPAEHSKNGNALEIHLSDFAVKQFETISTINHDTPWLYPNRSKKDHVNTKTITKQIGDRQCSEPMSKRSQKADALILPGGKWTPHDLRRTGATLMAALGVKPEVIDRCQNHKEENKIRRIYQRYSYASEMKEAWLLLGERLEALTANNSAVAKVIPLSKSIAINGGA